MNFCFKRYIHIQMNIRTNYFLYQFIFIPALLDDSHLAVSNITLRLNVSWTVQQICEQRCQGQWWRLSGTLLNTKDTERLIWRLTWLWRAEMWGFYCKIRRAWHVCSIGVSKDANKFEDVDECENSVVRWWNPVSDAQDGPPKEWHHSRSTSKCWKILHR